MKIVTLLAGIRAAAQASALAGAPQRRVTARKGPPPGWPAGRLTPTGI